LGDGIPSASNDPVVRQAERLANEGHIAKAEHLFAQATLNSGTLESYVRYARYLIRIGRLTAANSILNSAFVRFVRDNSVWEAAAHDLSGMIRLAQGRLDDAERHYQHSLDLAETGNDFKAKARALGNLGTVGDMSSV